MSVNSDSSSYGDMHDNYIKSCKVKALSWEFVNCFFFFLGNLSANTAAGIFDSVSLSRKCMEMHMLYNHSPNLQQSRKRFRTYLLNRLPKPKHRRVELSKPWYKKYNTIQHRKANYFRLNNRSGFSNYHKYTRVPNGYAHTGLFHSANLYKYFGFKPNSILDAKRSSVYTLAKFDKRRVIYYFFSRSLMLESSMYSFYGSSIFFFSLRHLKFDGRLWKHGSSFLKSILHKPVIAYYV